MNGWIGDWETKKIESEKIDESYSVIEDLDQTSHDEIQEDLQGENENQEITSEKGSQSIPHDQDSNNEADIAKFMDAIVFDESLKNKPKDLLSQINEDEDNNNEDEEKKKIA